MDKHLLQRNNAFEPEIVPFLKWKNDNMLLCDAGKSRRPCYGNRRFSALPPAMAANDSANGRNPRSPRASKSMAVRIACSADQRVQVDHA
jgi:hypothetical protein